MSHLTKELRALGFNPRRDTRSVWDLRRGWPFTRRFRNFTTVHDIVVAAALATPPIFLEFDDDPADEYPQLHWECTSPSFWRLPADIDLHTFDRTILSHGGWTLCCGALSPPRKPCPNFFQTDSQALLTWACEHGFSLLVQSFLDDGEWVLVDREAEQGAALDAQKDARQ